MTTRASAAHLLKQPPSAALLALLAVLVVGLLGAGIHQALANNTLGFEFFNFWTAGRAFFVEQRNPYSDEIQREIQLGLYGRPALPHEDPMPFNYPPHILFALLPTLPMSFSWAQAYWMAINLVGVLVLFFLGFPKAPRWLLVSIPFLYNYVFGLALGSFTVLISAVLGLFAGYFIIARGSTRAYQVWTGILLAWCTAKPQAVVLYLPFFLLFCFRHRLKPLLVSFFAGCAVFLTITLLFQPDWPLRWFERVVYYTQYTAHNRPTTAILDVFVRPFFPHYSTQVGYLVIAVLGLAVTLYCTYRWWKGSLTDFTMLAAAGVTTYLLMPNNSSADQLSLLLPLVSWCAWQSPARMSARAWWLVLFSGGYLAFFLSRAHVYDRGLAAIPFLIVLAWLVYLGIRKVMITRRQAASPAASL